MNKVVISNEINVKDIELNNNAIVGNSDHLYDRLKESFNKANSVDIIVSFLMVSGVEKLLEDINKVINKGGRVRILTGNYLNITDPQALFLLKSKFNNKIDLRFYNVKNKSFHPKSYIFHHKNDSEIYIGSSNISKGALTDSIEWNLKFMKSTNPNEYNKFYETFQNLFLNYSEIIDDRTLQEYSASWRKPKIYMDIEKVTPKENQVTDLFKPRDAQIEALYKLNKTREEGFDKGLVVAATGIGKTYLAAFDSRNYEKILFVAHREEILKQAAISFKNVRNSTDIGFFYNETKDTNKSFVFALVQTLGKKEYLNEEYFPKDYFDYIVIDEFHHAVSSNYRNIIDYFKPKFLLGITATPERLDSKDVFCICDYNTVYEIRLSDAINKGYLVPFRYYGIYDETVDYNNIMVHNGKYDNKALEEALMFNKRGTLIVNNYNKYNSSRALGFCSSKKHAEYMARFFNEKGIKSVAVYSGLGGEFSEERHKAIEDLVKGNIKVIFSVDMFNEGLDIPSIDLVMFLRPTESPTIFLQQLGRGLRKYKNKKYLNVLDFIGNYKKANLIPFLLCSKNYSSINKNSGTCFPNEEEYPEDCIVNFDFQIIDIFQKQKMREVKINEIIKEDYYRVQEEIGHKPNRVEFYNNISSDLYSAIKKSKPSLNPFNNYLGFLQDINEISSEEKDLLISIANDFINMIEKTSMSKSYKIPVLLAFYNEGNIKMNITEKDVYESFYNFYHLGTNKVDMLRHKNTMNFEKWTMKDYIKLAKENPIKFLLKTEHDFFVQKEGFLLSLSDEMEEIISNEAFIINMEDAIRLREKKYYSERIMK